MCIIISGFFGATLLGLLLIPFYYIKVGSFSHTAGHRLENVPDAFEQMRNNWQIIAATVGKTVTHLLIKKDLH